MQAVVRRSRQGGEERRTPGTVPQYTRAVALWEAGDFELCLHALDELGAEGLTHQRYRPPSILLRARVLLRMGLTDQARDWLAQNAIQFTDPAGDASATHAMLTGRIHAALKAYDEAEKWFARGRRCNPHPGVLAEIGYYSSLALYQQGRFPDALSQLDLALQTAPDILYARSRSLRGWILTAESRYKEAYHDFNHALDATRGCTSRDVHLQASTIYALAIAAAELQLGDVQRLEAEAVRLHWTTDLAGEKTQTLRHLGLTYLRAGDRDRAIGHFIASTEAAPGTPWSMFGFIECANMALSRGEEIGTLSLARKAASLADRHVWEDITGEQRIPLLLLAQLYARLGDGERAQAFRRLYYKHAGLSNMSALQHDTRLLTFERHVEGCVLAAMGMRDAASALLTTTLDEWARIAFTFRANEAREDLQRINPTREDRLVTLVRPHLSTREEQLLRLIVDGMSNKELAEHFHIAVNTVKNTVLKLYSKFNVHNRTQLVVAARGLSSPRRDLS